MRQPTQHALAEHRMRTLTEKHVAYPEYMDVADAERQLKHWLEVEG
jgi:hypothetical protein